ncbi:MAG TPA: DUF58 domain-containing protein [Polyangiaceae bacterium]|jgi:uncharacterized protein (DUF58 family)|nr:DUF58 domain-containing protein [Polyangiaceae bacterium]
MSLLDFVRGALPSQRRSKAQVKRSQVLFDDDFQRRLETLAIVSRRVFAGRQRAERRSKKKGSGVEFADHRNYVPGDDFRFVDWNAYQRFGRLLVRLYEEEEDLSITFVLDCSRSMGFGDGAKFDQARRLCAALAYVGLANLDRVGISAVGDTTLDRLPATRGKGRIFKVFRFLSELEPNTHTDLGEALKMVVAQNKRRGMAVLISDLYDPQGFENGINVLRYNKFEPYVLHIVDPREATPKLKGDVRIYDCETGAEQEVTVTDELLGKMEAAFSEYQREIESFCVKNQVPYFRANTDAPFDELVLSVFRKGGFLR